MKTIKIIDILKVMLVVLFFDTLFLGQSFLRRADWQRVTKEYELMIVVLFGFILLLCAGYITIKREAVNDMVMIVGPYLFIFIVSAVEVLLFHNVSMGWTINQNMYPVLSLVAAFFAVKIFDKQAIDLVTYGAIADYTIYVFLYFYNYGLFGLTNFFTISESHNYKNYLEVHEATFVMGLLLIYYCIDSFKANRVKIIWLAIYVFLGYKRILFPAIFLGIVAGLIIIKKERKVISMLMTSITFVVITGWLFFVTSPYYELVAAALGIELNSRTFTGNGLYGRLNGYYTMSVTYIGSGIGFVQQIMYNVADALGSTVYGLHNDILKYYIDLGFIPFFLFMIFRIYIVPYYIHNKRTTYDVAIYVGTLMMTLICWTTDNIAMYPSFLFASFLVICYAICGKEGRSDLEIKNKATN